VTSYCRHFANGVKLEPLSPAAGSSKKAAKAEADELGSVLCSGGGPIESDKYGGASRGNLSSYSSAYVGAQPLSGHSPISRSPGTASEETPWLPAARGVTHARMIQHEADECWAPGLQTSYNSAVPSLPALKKTLKRSVQQMDDSRHMGRNMGLAISYEEAERRWQSWHKRSERERPEGANTVASGSTMPAGVKAPKKNQESFTRIKPGLPLLSEEESSFQQAMGPRGTCGHVASVPAPPSDTQAFSVLFPSVAKKPPPQPVAHARWQGRFACLLVAKRPRLDAVPRNALTRRGEDLG